VALLQAALSSGLLDAARAPGTSAQLATATGLDAARVADLCLALDAHGVLDREGEAYRLSPDFATLADPDAPQTLTAIVGRAPVVARLLAHAADPDEAYATLPPDDLLAMARGAAAQPGSALALGAMERMFETRPEAKAIYQGGGRHLEVGCGVGGALLNLLVLFPALTAVGVERESRLLDEARRRAAELGVADRVEWRAMDARDLRDEAAFNTASWSQFFFPAETRAATLAVARRALKPGGYLGMPLLPDPPVTREELREPSGRAYARARVLYGGWGIPVQTAEEVRAEVEAAGFTFIRFMALPAARGLLARRPED
jgi:SAM-dependent methyltransferase